MKNSIKTAIDKLFETLSFSREKEQQKEKILSFAYQKFNNELDKGICPAEAAGKILIHCASVEDLCSYLDMEASIPVQKSEKILTEDIFLKIVKKLRKNIYILSFLFSGIISSGVSSFQNISASGIIFTVIIWTVLSMFLYVIVKKQKCLIKEYHFFLRPLRMVAEKQQRRTMIYIRKN